MQEKNVLTLLQSLAVVCGVFPASAAPAQDGEDAFLVSFAIVLFVLLPTIAVIVMVTRAMVKRKVDRMMMVSSDEQTSGVLQELEAGEVRATVTPEFVLLDARSELSDDDVAMREALVAQDRGLLARGVRRDLLAAFGYFLVSRIDPPGSLAKWNEEAPVIIASALAFLAVVRYVVWGWESKAEKSTFAKLARLAAVWPPVRPAKPEWRPHVSALAIFVAVLAGISSIASTDVLVGLALLVAAAFHTWLIANLMVSSRGAANLKLMVLRVFGVDETAAFTFEGLLGYWRHFGTFFTIVDPSFLKSEQRRRSLLPEFLILVAALLFILSVELDAFATSPVLFVSAGVLPATLALGTGYGFLSLRQVDRDFVRERNDVLERLQRLDAWPRALDLTFRSMPMMCHDNTWKIAVSECVGSSDAVLMDLRGFSKERQGCTYEVDYLLDVIPIDRVVFLVEREGVSPVQDLILDLWKLLRTTSPNLERQDPRAIIYVTSEENDRDIQGLCDVLLTTANARAAA